MPKVAVIGSGVVGQVLADGFLKHGYEVVRATREPAKLEEWLKGAGAKASVAQPAEAARQSELVVLAVQGNAAEAAVALCEGLEPRLQVATSLIERAGRVVRQPALPRIRTLKPSSRDSTTISSKMSP